MIQRRQDLRLPPESDEAIGVRRERVGKDLERDVAIQFRVMRQVDVAHAARAENGTHLV